MIKLYSFDIFDTCVVRTCGTAKYVFDMLAENILGSQASPSIKNDFAFIRMEGERKARHSLINGELEEITIEQIYNYCDFTSMTDVDNAIIMQTEMDIENSVLLPVRRIQDKINLLVEQGATVIYISDMYLPIEFIEKIMIERGFYVNNNIYLSSDVKKSKCSGHLYDYVLNKFGIKGCNLQHIGDNYFADYKIPRSRSINACMVSHSYNQYEKMGKRFMLDGIIPLSGYAFTLSRAVRLSFPDTPNYKFASTFIAPMLVPFVYSVLRSSLERKINHLFFIARDGYILYKIALEMANLFPEIKMSYLFASRQSLYMAGLNKLSPECILEELPHLKNKTIKGILYELHLPSYDYSKFSFSGLDGEQIIKLLFTDNCFVEALTEKYREQNDYIIKYFEQVELTKGNCATVDVIGSRRCQKAINNILSRYNYPKIFSYYFEVTWCRIPYYEPYSAANYQENVINTPNYNRASQPLYEQFFVITNQKRTIEYQLNGNTINPVFEDDFLDEGYKKETFENNLAVCVKYTKSFLLVCESISPISIIQVAQKVFASFCYIPRKDFLKALESFRCTGSGEANELLLSKKNLIYVFTHISNFFRWPEGQIVYSSGWLYPLIRVFLEIRLLRKHFV